MRRVLSISILFLFTLLFIGASEPFNTDKKDTMKCPYMIKMQEKSEKGSCPYSGKSGDQIKKDDTKKDSKCPYSGKSNENKIQKSSKRLITI